MRPVWLVILQMMVAGSAALGAAAPAAAWAAAASAPVMVYTHGDGPFAMLQPDGSMEGPGAELLHCTMTWIGVPYRLAAMSMARSELLEKTGKGHIWFPSYDDGDPVRAARLVGPIGAMSIYWFTRKGSSLDPEGSAFKATGNVGSFPSSRPAEMLRKQGYQLVDVTDDENRLLLWLIEGRVDAIFSGEFRDTLKAGSAELAKRITAREAVRLPAAFEVTEDLVAERPSLVGEMRTALGACRATGAKARK